MTAYEFPFKWVVVKSNLLNEDAERRINASSYSLESLQALQKLEKLKRKNINIVNIHGLCDNIFYPSRFKRTYTKNGTLFLSSKDILNFVLTGKKVKNLDKEYLVQDNWILVTRSGSVGRVVWANKNFDNIGVSEHVIRVIPRENIPAGYLYAYLSSNFGQSLLLRKIFGGVVKEIEPSHIGNMPIPLLPESDTKEINKKMLEAQKLRQEAQELLLKAEKLLYKELDLPIITEENVNYLGTEKEKLAKAYMVKSQQIFIKNLRLNAFSYFPLCLLAESLLEKKEKEGKFKLKKLKEIAQKIFTPPRFKRIYIKPSEGIPLLQGSHIPMVKYFDLKYISKKTENMDSYIIKEGWILVTCSGTVGRVFLTTKFCDGWAATNHMTRIIPSDEVNAGYLTIFLQSPYALSQLEASIYGGVVEEIGEAGELIGELWVPVPIQSLQEKIGAQVSEAYEKKDQANVLEEKAIKFFERKLEELAK